MGRQWPLIAASVVLVGCGDTPADAVAEVEEALAARDYRGVEVRVDVEAISEGFVAYVLEELDPAIPEELTADERELVRVRAARALSAALEDAIEDGSVVEALRDGRFLRSTGLPLTVGSIAWDVTFPELPMRLRGREIGNLSWGSPQGVWRVVAFTGAPGMIPLDEDAIDAWAAMLVVEADLYQLIADQRAHRRGEYQFSSDAERTGWGARRGVTVEVLEASERGWAAAGSHATAPALQCSVFVGQAFSEVEGLVLTGSDGAGSGVVYCD